MYWKCKCIFVSKLIIHFLFRFTISRASERNKRVFKLFLSRRNFELTALFAETFILEVRDREDTNYGTFMELSNNFETIKNDITDIVTLIEICKVSLIFERAQLASAVVELITSFDLTIDSLILNLEIKAKWVTRYYLTNLFINCKELYMENCELTYSDYFMFFKQWIRESRVEVAKMQMKEHRKFLSMFKQLEATPVNKITHYNK